MKIKFKHPSKEQQEDLDKEIIAAMFFEIKSGVNKDDVEDTAGLKMAILRAIKLANEIEKEATEKWQKQLKKNTKGWYAVNATHLAATCIACLVCSCDDIDEFHPYSILRFPITTFAKALIALEAAAMLDTSTDSDDSLFFGESCVNIALEGMKK